MDGTFCGDLLGLPGREIGPELELARGVASSNPTISIESEMSRSFSQKFLLRGVIGGSVAGVDADADVDDVDFVCVSDMN